MRYAAPGIPLTVGRQPVAPRSHDWVCPPAHGLPGREGVDVSRTVGDELDEVLVGIAAIDAGAFDPATAQPPHRSVLGSDVQALQRGEEVIDATVPDEAEVGTPRLSGRCA